MKKTLLFGLFMLISHFLFAQIENEDNPNARIEHEIRTTLDPKLGRVPYERLIAEREKLHEGLKNNSIKAAITGLTWYERGPNNIGGRTRAVMFDPNDATKKRVWAGGVGGGLWYNNDITNAATLWTKIDDFWANIAISCIAYDPSNTQIMYVGTGEVWGSLDALQGAGVYKTTNGGTTWSLIASTTTGGANANAFKYTQQIVVNSFGEVFAGTQSGILKSINGGTSWTTTPTITGRVTDMEIASDGVIYVGTNTSVFKSVDRGVNWTNTLTDAVSRVEIALAPSTSGATQTIYAMGDIGGYAPAWIKKSTNAGATWANVGSPTPSILGAQGWYDMIMTVHPTNPNLVIAGGNVIARTIDGGATWVIKSYGTPHPDQHAVVFRPGATNEVVIGNDGGVIYSTDYGNSALAGSFLERNNGYNVTQYYGISMKNIANDGYVIGGTQDNNTLTITSADNVVGGGVNVNGGDGIASFVDQNEPTIALVSAQYGAYSSMNTTTNVKTSLGVGSSQFITVGDYDSVNNTFYVDKSDGTTIWKVRNVGGAKTTNFYNTGIADPISFIRCGINQHTIFVGTGIYYWNGSYLGGKIYKITNFGEAGQATTLIGTLNVGGVSSISVGATENELLVTLANYGIKSVYYTNDGGTTWTSKDEAGYGLPDIPVRYGMFNPLNRKQVLLGTELGVWTTTDITATNPGWAVVSAAMANVSCFQLYYRSADNTVAVATHGRGIFTTKLPTCPTDIVRQSNESISETLFSGTYIKGNTANLIQTGVNKTYSAKNYVLLEPKFETQSGAIFQALIGGCENVAIPGLVAYYPFNGNANDESTNNNNGVVNGATLTTDRFGDANKAYAFDGVDDRINANVGAEMYSAEKTISVWAMVSGAGSFNPRLVGVGPHGSSLQYYSLLLEGLTSPRRLWFFTYNAVSQAYSNTLVQNSSLWNHYTVTYNGSAVKIYINGILDSETAVTGSLNNFSSALLQIGYSDNGLDWFDGKLDDIRIYNRAISDAEILALYNAEKP
jgi:hypothetical protein